MKPSVQPVTSPSLPAPMGPYLPPPGLATSCLSRGRPAAIRRRRRWLAPTSNRRRSRRSRTSTAILAAAGSGLQHVLRCGVFLVDMAEFPRMNEVYARMFGGHRPARTTVQVAALPGEGLRVEIDAIAVIPEA